MSESEEDDELEDEDETFRVGTSSDSSAAGFSVCGGNGAFFLSRRSVEFADAEVPAAAGRPTLGLDDTDDADEVDFFLPLPLPGEKIDFITLLMALFVR